MGTHSVCVSIFWQYWYYIYIFCWFIYISLSWMYAMLRCSRVVFEATEISWNATLRRLHQVSLLHYTVAGIVVSNDCINYARVITFTTLIIGSLLTCHHIFRQSPKLASTRHYDYMWPRFFVLYAFCAITNLRDPEIDTKCSKCLLSEKSQQMYVGCGVALSWVQLPLLVCL